jgi:type VI secretion system protein ImpM
MEPGPSFCGFYGKLIAAGDFVRRGFPGDLYEHWDPWLQRGLLFSREELGEAWLSAYLSAPLWRFALASGVAGERAWVGAMMPSVDRVGRYFPLTVVAEAQRGASVFSTARAAEPWLQEIEQTLLETLEGDGLDADTLVERLAAPATVADKLAIGATVAAEPADEESEHLVIQTPARPDSALIACTMASLLARRQLGEDLSLWWSAGSARVAAGARLYRGLPVESEFRRLLADDDPSI